MQRKQQSGSPVPMLQITPKDRQTLQMLADGEAIAAIARYFEVREADVESDLLTLFAALGAADRSEAVAIACRRGLIDNRSDSPSLQ
jgi:DNA-binding NarL/FixJ family response regulator